VRLIELKPRWVGINPANPDKHYVLPGGQVAPSPIHIGVSFICPHCLDQRLAVLFHPIIDPDGWAVKNGWALPDATNKRWQRTGDTFNTLTLKPSIDCSGSKHWHGFVTNGEVT
jgi:hypothetical protein